MKLCLWAVVLALFVNSVAMSADWAKMEADYKATRERLEKQGPPPCYVTQAHGKTLAFNTQARVRHRCARVRPESCRQPQRRQYPLRPTDHVLVCRREDQRAGQV